MLPAGAAGPVDLPGQSPLPRTVGRVGKRQLGAAGIPPGLPRLLPGGPRGVLPQQIQQGLFQLCLGEMPYKTEDALLVHLEVGQLYVQLVQPLLLGV